MRNVILTSGMAAILSLALLAHGAELASVDLEPRGEVLRIVVAGDTGSGSEALARGIRAVHAAAPVDAIVLTGDTFYPCGPASTKDSQWSLVRPITSIGIPVFPVLGNHDFCGKSDPGAQVRASGTIANWRMPARQFALRTRLADFVFLDTTPFARATDRTAAAAMRTLKTSKKRWQVAVGHHPLVSSGYHGYFPRAEVRRMSGLVPVAIESGVDLYLTGHDHHLELIRGRITHVVSGAGSEPIPPVKLRTTTVYPREIGWERLGFAVVELTKTKIRVRFYDANGKGRTEWL